MIALKPYPKQLSVLQDQHKYVLLTGSRRSGKGQVALMKVLSIAFGFDQWSKMRSGKIYQISPTSPAVIIVVAPSLTMVRTLHFKVMCELIERTPALKSRVKSINKSSMRIDLFGNSPSIIYASLGNDSSGDNLRGLKACAVICDEAADLQYDSIMTTLSISMTDVPCSQMLILGSPKGRGANCLFRFHQLAERHPDICSEHHITIYDNPYIAKADIDREKLLKTEVVFNREYMAQYLDFAGSIYPGLSEDTIKALPEGKPYRTWLGVDLGSSNPCIGVIGIYDGLLYILDGWYNDTGGTISHNELNTLCLKFSNHYECVGAFVDPSIPASINDMRALGRSSGDLGLTKAVGGYNPIVSGITQLQAHFEHGRLFIADNHKRRIGNLSPIEILEQLSSYDLEN